MKVVHALRSLEFGGAEKLVIELASRQVLSGDIDVELACINPGGALEAEAISRELPVSVTGLGKIRYFSGISRMRKYLHTARPDLVHTHNFLAHTHTAPAARMLGIPVIHTKHGRAVTSMSWSPALRRYIYSLAHAVVVVSKETGEIFAERSGVRDSKIKVIHNGIDLERYRNIDVDRRSLPGLEKIDKEDLLFGAVSRLDPVKDHTTMLRAFAEVAASRSDCYFLIVGDGPERGNIETLIKELSIEDRVIMTGFTDEVPLYVSAMDMYLQPSLEEGLSLTLLEAAAAGVPVVVTPVGGNPEVIEGGFSGSFVDVGNYHGMAAIMDSFMEDPAPFREMALRAGESVEAGFSLTSMEAGYRALYMEAISREETL
ncbi:MAG: glycosyltransferase [Candidatus Krumholzibacteria bacterium]|nr:glycosyltransferase [Candidatus Krumholzibacteria bacterium]